MRGPLIFLILSIVLLEQFVVFGEDCTINCYYHPKELKKVLKCLHAELKIPENTIMVKCEVRPVQDKLILYIGSREYIDSIEPTNWNLPTPESDAVDHLELMFHISKIDANTFSKTFPKLRSLVIYKVDNLATNTFSGLGELRNLRIQKNPEILHNKSYLFSRKISSQSLNLNYNTTCFKCPRTTGNPNLIVDFQELSNDMEPKRVFFDDCQDLPLRDECNDYFSDPIQEEISKGNLLQENPKVETTILTEKPRIRNLSYNTLVFLICISLFTTFITLICVLIVIALVEKMRQIPNFIEKYSSDILIIDNKSNENTN